MVELISNWGGDLTTVNVARVSYGKEVEEFQDRDIKLLNYLVKFGHSSPFRHSSLQFRITCPIYVERQLRKHEIGIEVQPIENISVNSLSGRYVDFSDSYTTIDVWRKQSKSSKQGSDGEVTDQKTCRLIEAKVISVCKEAYSILCEMGVAKELARTLLPLNLNTTFIWTGSFLAFVHMCNLRLKQDAQYETRLIVQDMLNQVKQLDNFKYSLKAFNL